MPAHRMIRPGSVIGIAALAAVSLLAVVTASREGGPGSTAPALTTPAGETPTGASATSASASSALPNGSPATAAPSRTVKSSFRDEQLEEAVRARRARDAHIEALVRYYGMPEEDIERLMAGKDRELAHSGPYACGIVRASETAGLWPLTAE